MSKLTKPQIKMHEHAVNLIARDNLTHDDILFIYENYREEAEHINSKAGAFFTPYGLARDFTLQIPYYSGHRVARIIDICAGTGILSYAASFMYDGQVDITCIEINPDYVEIGKKLVPNANWICGDTLDPNLLGSLGKFDFAMANPPFGLIHNQKANQYVSKLFEYMVIEASAQIADEGAFIIPQMSAPFRYSGSTYYIEPERCRARDFEDKTGISMEFNVGIDTSVYSGEWHGTSPICEIVCCDFRKRVGQLSFDTAISA